jgi:hypothetical protein
MSQDILNHTKQCDDIFVFVLLSVNKPESFCSYVLEFIDKKKQGENILGVSNNNTICERQNTKMLNDYL